MSLKDKLKLQWGTKYPLLIQSLDSNRGRLNFKTNLKRALKLEFRILPFIANFPMKDWYYEINALLWDDKGINEIKETSKGDFIANNGYLLKIPLGKNIHYPAKGSLIENTDDIYILSEKEFVTFMRLNKLTKKEALKEFRIP